MDQIGKILTWSPLISVWVASLLGSIHCTGMCGVVFLHVTGSERKNVFLYHAARGMTYVGLGACFGGFSQLLYFEFAYGLLKVAFSIGFAFYLVWLGLEILWFGRSLSIETVYRWLGFEKFSLKFLKPSSNRQGSLKSLLIGTMTAFLPCGWLLSFLGISLASLSAAKGAGIMLAFWMGTVPWMEALRIGNLNFIHSKFSKHRNYLWVRNAIALVLMVNGVFFMAKHAKMHDFLGTPKDPNIICGPSSAE